MLKTIRTSFAVALALVVTSPAWAASLLCPPLSIGEYDFAECKVTNFANWEVSGVAIIIYDDDGGNDIINRCPEVGSMSLGPKETKGCVAYNGYNSDNYSCEVIGVSVATTRAAFVTWNEEDDDSQADAAVHCY